MVKELLFSVTADDCDWQYMRSSGPGGQNVNKRSTKVRCIHRASGAVGESDETRFQPQNKRKAFLKMIETKEFKTWHKIKTAMMMGDKMTIDERVAKAMDDRNIKIEVKEDGKWVPAKNLDFDKE